jgi:hypothetical protein
MATRKPETTGSETPSHTYHAEAHLLSGRMMRPVEEEILHQAKLALNDKEGGHLTSAVKGISIEGLVKFAKGETRVSGSRSLKNNGWITLSTAVVERLNVFEIITADRLVSQVSTEHPYEDGHIPHVTFLGTQFNNLRVSGFLAKLTVNLGSAPKRPEGGKSYLEDVPFLQTVKEQTAKIANAEGLPKELKAQYDERLASLDKLIESASNGKPRREPRIVWSLVQSIGEIPIPGVKSFGHILVIPEFGTVALGEVSVSERIYEGSRLPSPYFELTSIKMNLGCVGHGNVAAGTVVSNGHHNP